jgi:hypothetical protein
MDTPTTTPIDENTGAITAPPNLTVDTAAATLKQDQQTEVKTAQPKSFNSTQKINADISPTSTALRSVANEGNQQASLIKPDAKKLNTIEKYIENAKIELDIARKRDVVKDLVYKQTSLRDRGLDLSEEDKAQIDITEFEMVN